jgi:hypothetical protein
MNRPSCVLAAVLAFPSLLPAAAADGREQDVRALARRIDQRIEAVLKEKKVAAAPPSSDAEFLRRVYLDVAGRIPSVAEARAFLDERRPDRRRLVERLLASPAYANHQSAVWRAALVPQSQTNTELQYVSLRLETWLRNRIKANVGYDRLVRELLATPLPYQKSPAAEDPPPVAFFQANELKAETLAGSVARLFLGVQLQCAECHNHPFASWTRKQFWETAAFFAGVPPVDRPGRRDEPSTLRMPGGNRTVAARFLDGAPPPARQAGRPRQAFADWLTGRQNPYFAPATVNRVWAQFFGVGLVDPVDDFGEHNPPSHPALLADLAAAFVKHDFDIPFLIRAITSSAAYQRSSAPTSRDQDDPRLFARRQARGLSAEQLFDSLALATGYADPVPRAHRPLFGAPADSPRGLFLKKFAGAGQRTDVQTSILQALTLMNGPFVARQTHPEHGKLLAAVTNAPFLDDRGKLQTLYLAALSRMPTEGELRRLLARMKGGNPRTRPADVFWALLNSPEFLLNH